MIYKTASIINKKMKIFCTTLCILISLNIVITSANIKDVAIIDDKTGLAKHRCTLQAPSNIEELEGKFREYLQNTLFILTDKVGMSDIKHLRGTPKSNINISVYFHVINKGYEYDSGNLDDATIASQIRVLNSGFSGSGFVFVLNGTDRTTNSVWFNMTQGSIVESQAKQRLRKGGPYDLNIYSAAPGDDSLGWGTYPWDYAKVPTGDGVVILYSTVPNGTCTDYNLGNTLNHEVGHWMGLYHTFQGGCCDGTTCGDYVADTPAESSPTYGCPSSRDTCNKTGLDSIGDYMNYCTDVCTNYFTRGQANRMTSMWNMYRNKTSS